MTQNGSGALDEWDIRHVQSGVTFIIPRPNGLGPIVMTGGNAQSISCIEEAERVAGLDRTTLFQRATMYIAVAFCEEISKGEAIHCRQVTPGLKLDVGFYQPLYTMIQTALPIRITRVVVIRSFDEQHLQLLEFLRDQASSLVRHNIKVEPQQIYGNSVKETVQLLEQNGFPRQIVPQEFGGDYPFRDKVAQWARFRVQMESFLAPVPPLLVATGGTAIATPAIAAAMIATNNTATSALVPASKAKRYRENGPLVRRRDFATEAEYRRERNRVYQKRHYYKHGLDQMSLEGQQKQLEVQNAALRRENQKLEEALHMAQCLVTNIMQTMG